MDATKKLTTDTCLFSSEEYREYKDWSVGRETRVFKHPDRDATLIVRLEGWAETAVIEAHERCCPGDMWPEFFYEARWEGLDIDLGVYHLDGGKIPVSELESYRAQFPGDTVRGWAWSFVLTQIEQRI